MTSIKPVSRRAGLGLCEGGSLLREFQFNSLFEAASEILLRLIWAHLELGFQLLRRARLQSVTEGLRVISRPGRSLAFSSQGPQFLSLKHKDSGALCGGCWAAEICRPLKVEGADSVQLIVGCISILSGGPRLREVDFTETIPASPEAQCSFCF